MKVLIVGMSHSIHTARWVNQFLGMGWDIHIFPSDDRGLVHAAMEGVTVHHSVYSPKDIQATKINLVGRSHSSSKIAAFRRSLLKKYYPNYREKQLRNLIKKLQPDLIHSAAIESAGFLTLQAKKGYGGVFPPWLVSNWGNDLYFFGRLSEYSNKVKEVLISCDHYSCESKRDEDLAIEFGFKGIIYPYIQAGGGWDLEKLAPIRNQITPSQRTIIAVKGYQNLMGRASVALRALERCKDVLGGLEVVIFSPIPEKDVRMLAEWFSFNTKIPTKIFDKTTNYLEVLKLQAQARIFIGLSISDGVSNAFLEAMIMGAFPIQSYPSNTHEWLEEGVTGISVSPEDPEIVEKAIRRALGDNSLVDNAAVRNWSLAQDKLDAKIVREKVIKMYQTIINQ